MNKYLITGFAGFVSRHFIEYLANKECHCIVQGLDVRMPDFIFDDFKNVKVDFKKINLLSKERIKNIIAEFQPNYILHFASLSSVAYSWKEPVQSFKNDTNILLNLLDSTRKLNLNTRVLVIGSSEEYGSVKNEDLPLKEEHKLNPCSPYAVARMAQEYLSRVYVDHYGLDIVLTRSFNHIGPGQKSNFVVPSIAKQLIAKKIRQKTRVF